MMREGVLLVGMLLAAGRGETTAATQPDPAPILARASSVFQGLASYQADFKQQIADSMIGTFESRGHLVQAGTSKLAMRFDSPKGEAIVMDGSHVWVYTPSTAPGQVIRMPLPSGPTFGPNVLAWLLDRPAERYRSRYVRADQLGGRPMDVITLVPVDPALPFTDATLWLDRADALPRRLEIHERSGSARTLTLSSVRVNGHLADDTFRFVVPSGVRVVDQ
jgi:outer membrane lipoprotein carrier protein